MSHHLIATVMATLAVVSLAALVPALRRARRSGDWDASSVLVLAMGWLYVLPVALVALSATLRRQPDAYGDLIPVYPGWYGAASQLGIFLVGILAAGLAIARLRGQFSVHPAPLVAITLWSVTQLVALRTGGGLVSGRALVLLLCLVAAAILPRGRGGSVGAGVFGVTLAAGSGLLAALHYNVAFVVPCRDSCGGLGFNGLVPNPDLLADMLAVTVAFAYLGFRGRSRYWFTAYLVLMVLATGSVTASVAALVTLALVVVLRPRLGDERPRTAAAIGVGGLLLGTVAASAFAVTHAWSASALSGRPALWHVATDYIRHAPWLGYGAGRWSGLYHVSVIPYADQRSAHNLWLDVLFAGGFVGAALLAGLVVVLVCTAGRTRLGVLIAVTAVALVGVAEPAWLTSGFDVLSYSFVAALLLGSPTTLPERAALDRAGVRSVSGEAVAAC